MDRKIKFTPKVPSETGLSAVSTSNIDAAFPQMAEGLQGKAGFCAPRQGELLFYARTRPPAGTPISEVAKALRFMLERQIEIMIREADDAASNEN